MKYNAIINTQFSLEATTEPVSIAEAKEHLRLSADNFDEEAIIMRLIKTARLQCERYTALSLINRTVKVVLINGLGGIKLPYGPVKVIASVKDFDTLLLLTDYQSANGIVKTYFEDSLEFEYTAGFTVIPDDIKTAILMQVDWLYNNRGSDARAVEPPYKTQLSKYVA